VDLRYVIRKQMWVVTRVGRPEVVFIQHQRRSKQIKIIAKKRLLYDRQSDRQTDRRRAITYRPTVGRVKSVEDIAIIISIGSYATSLLFSNNLRVYLFVTNDAVLVSRCR